MWSDLWVRRLSRRDLGLINLQNKSHQYSTIFKSNVSFAVECILCWGCSAKTGLVL
jgi:hypothetical protein